ncbi:MAG: GAF domain-containing protein, partial [Chloroflexi bacterium]|nr:GAF domain-containing protein [Chloroflexota bacterium]
MDEVLAVVREALEKQRLVQDKRQAEEALRVSHRFLEIANRHTEMLPLLEEFVAEAKNFTGCAAVGIRLLDEKGNIPYEAYEGFSQEFYESESPLSIKSDQCMCINVIKGMADPTISFYTEGGSFYTESTTRLLATVSEEETGPTRNVCHQFGYETVVLVPIRLGERTLGLIHVADPQENMVPLEMVEVLEAAAMELGTAIQRVRAEEALQASARQWRITFDAIGDGVWLADREGRILRCNEAVTKLLGKPFSEIIGHACYEVVHGTSAPIEGCPFERMRESRRREAIVLSLGDRWFEVTTDPLLDEDGNLTGAVHIVTDITERKWAEEEVQRHLERIEALREIDIAISSTLDLTEVLDIILKELGRVIPYHSAGIFLLSDGTAKLTAGRGFPDMERALQISFPAKEDPLTHELLQEGHPLVLADAQADERFRARGGTEYVRSWVGVPLIAKERAVGFLTIDHREPGVYDEESADMAQAFGSQVAIAIENARLYDEAQRELAERNRAEEELRQSYVRLERTLEGTVNTLVSAIEIRDPYTAGHQRQATQLACAVAREMGLPGEQVEGLRMAGLIHDIGKISIPAEVLSKPGQLSELEWSMIKAHPQVGYDILKTVEFPWPVAQIVLQHHERMDGSGYPQGLSGEELLLEARILAVADVVEAMASHRPYRPALGMDRALEEISQNRGVLYDPEVVDACLKLFIEKAFKFE